MTDIEIETPRAPLALAPDVHHLLGLLEWAGGGLDVRALVRRAGLPPDRLRAAIDEARALGRVRVRPRRAGRPGVPAEVDDIARVALARRRPWR
jgi:hypothetical protein